MYQWYTLALLLELKSWGDLQQFCLDKKAGNSHCPALQSKIFSIGFRELDN